MLVAELLKKQNGLFLDGRLDKQITVFSYNGIYCTYQTNSENAWTIVDQVHLNEPTKF